MGDSNRSVIIGVKFPQDNIAIVEKSLQESHSLSQTAGFDVKDSHIFKRTMPSGRYLIGEGQVEMVREICRKHKADVVIFDIELAPSQQKNLEKKLERMIVTRTEVILNIFAKRATSKEGKLQVELARLQYMMPRLTNMWTHLSRQFGKAGVRGGPGETQLEIDKRLVRNSIDKLKKEIVKVKQVRKTQRKQRQRNNVFTIALVGYTNAGKSTLINRLTEANRLEENRLFSSLDSKLKTMVIPETKTKVVFVDTVGFIQNLPHQLVEAFKATLEDIVHADMLVHVLDISEEDVKDRFKAVNGVLKEIGADQTKTVIALNKVDLLEYEEQVVRWEETIPDSFPISAVNSEGFDALFDKVLETQESSYKAYEFDIPFSGMKVLSYIRANGVLVKEKFHEDKVSLVVELAPAVAEKARDMLKQINSNFH